jgi:hypothetical protein
MEVDIYTLREVGSVSLHRRSLVIFSIVLAHDYPVFYEDLMID